MTAFESYDSAVASFASSMQFIATLDETDAARVCRFDGSQVRLFCTDPEMLDQVANTIADELDNLKAPERMLISMTLKAIRAAEEGKLYDCHKGLCCRP